MSEVDDTLQECFVSRKEIFLINNRGIISEQIIQWLALILMPIFTVLLIYAGILAKRTHRKLSFDGMCLFTVAVFNTVYLFNQFVRCTPFGLILNLYLSTCLILFTFYNFQIVVRGTEREVGRLV